MERIENECCDCKSSGYPCRGSVCCLRKTKHYQCNECGYDEDLYRFEGEVLCIGCIKSRLEKVE